MENDTSLELCVVYSNGNLTSTIRGYISTAEVSPSKRRQKLSVRLNLQLKLLHTHLVDDCAADRRDYVPISQWIQLTGSNPLCFNVTIIDDPFPEPQEQFRVFLRTLGWISFVHTDIVTVSIQDNGDGEQNCKTAERVCAVYYFLVAS